MWASHSWSLIHCLSSKPNLKKQVLPRLRIGSGDEVAIGPGKAELLERVLRSGSISEAARQMNMSYMRAWTLIRTMNRCFRKPVVVTTRGGRMGGGGAELTEIGQKVLTLYVRMNAECLSAIRSDWRQLQRLLRA